MQSDCQRQSMSIEKKMKVLSRLSYVQPITDPTNDCSLMNAYKYEISEATVIAQVIHSYKAIYSFLIFQSTI